jgi:hypothetical protein
MGCFGSISKSAAPVPTGSSTEKIKPSIIGSTTKNESCAQSRVRLGDKLLPTGSRASMTADTNKKVADNKETKVTNAEVCRSCNLERK